MASDHLSVAIIAARRAGSIIVQNLGLLGRDDITRKQPADFVTRVDTEAEEAIIATVREHFPGHSFLAEESVKDLQESGSGRQNYLWIIDPLDGTTNYIHGYPVFSVSIALQAGGRIRTGVVFDPVRDELFTAEEGQGAHLNGKRLAVSSFGLQEAVIATGFPFRNRELMDDYLRVFRSIFSRVSDLRRAGSAALDLASVASGRCDGYFEARLKPWDLAAGSLLVREAGGVVSDWAGGDDFLQSGNIVAAPAHIQVGLLKEIRAIFG